MVVQENEPFYFFVLRGPGKDSNLRPHVFKASNLLLRHQIGVLARFFYHIKLSKKGNFGEREREREKCY